MGDFEQSTMLVLWDGRGSEGIIKAAEGPLAAEIDDGEIETAEEACYEYYLMGLPSSLARVGLWRWRGERRTGLLIGTQHAFVGRWERAQEPNDA